MPPSSIRPAPSGGALRRDGAAEAGRPTSHDRKVEQQKRILTAAMACFAREGFHATPMQTICAEAGMSPGALYRYFASKEDLIAAIVADEGSERQRILDTVARAPSVVDALCECLRLLLEETPLSTAQLGPEIMAEAIRNTRLREIVVSCEQETSDQLGSAVAAAMERHEIDPALDVGDVMIMLQLIADGAILHHQLHPEWRLLERLPALSVMVRRMFAPPPATEA